MTGPQWKVAGRENKHYEQQSNCKQRPSSLPTRELYYYMMFQKIIVSITHVIQHHWTPDITTWHTSYDTKIRDCACNYFHLTNSWNQLQSPSTQFPSKPTHSCIPCCQCSKQFRISCSLRLLRFPAVLVFTFSTDTKWFPLSTDLIFGERQKSQGARSGE